MKTDDDPEEVGHDADTQWCACAADLRTYREAQRRAWGDLDEAAIARYLADEATKEERSRVEQAMRDFPKVRECVEVLREVMNEVDLGGEDRTESAGEESSQPIGQTPSKWRLFQPSSIRRLAPYGRPPASWSPSDCPSSCCCLMKGSLGMSPSVREKSAYAEPQIVAMKVEQYRDEGKDTIPVGTLGVDSPSAREKDLVRVSAKLDRPAYCYVIAFNPDGHDQLYYPPDRDVPPPKSAEIDYPIDEGYFPLAEGTGLQAFVLVASNEPLPPYERWRSGLGEVPWQPTQADGVWRSGSQGLELAMADTALVRGGPTEPSEPPPRLSQLHRFLATRPGVSAVRALAFPVKPQRGNVTPPKTD